MSESEKAIRHSLGEGSIAAVHGACNHRSIGALLVELDDARLDAKRYQWLRSRVPGSDYRIMGVVYSEGGSGVDAAIDAVMAQQEGAA